MKTYTFHVSLPGTGRVWRKIEMLADQTLEQLHHMIQEAFDFDDDHLYSFFMSGKAWDRKTEYCLPDDYDPLGFFTDEPPEDEEIEEENLDMEFDPQNPEAYLKFMFGDDADALEKARQTLENPLFQQIAAHLDEMYAEPGDVRVTKLDDLGLKIGKTFMYLFDYGDEWRFNVRVHHINFDAPEGDYPKIVQSVGDPPPQYPVYDGDYIDDDLLILLLDDPEEIEDDESESDNEQD